MYKEGLCQCPKLDPKLITYKAKCTYLTNTCVQESRECSSSVKLPIQKKKKCAVARHWCMGALAAFISHNFACSKSVFLFDSSIFHECFDNYHCEIL